MMLTRAFLAAFGAAALAGCAADAATTRGAAKPPGARDDGGVDVTLTTRDGVRLAATDWAGSAANERCVVLVHQLSSSREEWTTLVRRLRGSYEILSLDLRGHGESTRGPRGELAWKSFGGRDWEDAVLDLDAAARWLGERGFRTSDCVWIGSSIGASLVLRFAGERVDARGLVLLSPGLDYRGLRIAEAAERYPGPALVITSAQDAGANAVALLDKTWGDRLELLQLDGDAHGVTMLLDRPTLLDTIASFVERTLDAPARD
jgi:pimeloyl-ACP methyl ester carboxylesterase